MKRRSLIINSLAFSALAGMKVNAAEAWVNSINQYFNSIDSAYALFTQYEGSGKTSKGRFFLDKPGKMRFEYDAPNPALVVADGTALAIFDKKSNTGPQTYPQNSTPLSILAKSNVDLTSNKFVRQFKKSGGEGFVLVQDPARPNIGTLELRFRISPGKLLGWKSTDQSGTVTTVELSELHTGLAIAPDLFNIVKIKKELS